MTPCDPTSGGLAQLLEARSEDIARRWEEQARKRPSAARLPRAELLDSLPEFLVAVIAALRGSPAPDRPRGASLEALAETHGAQRFRLGFDPSEVVREYALLRFIIFNVLDEDHWPLEPQALNRLLDALATAIESSLRRYTQEHLSERKRAEEKLRQSETRYRLATMATQDLVWDWNIMTGQVDWSDSLSRLTGHPASGVDTSIGWWEEHIHPEDRQRVVSGLQAALEGGDAHWMDEYRFLRGDGAYMLVRDRAYVARDAEGRALRMVGALQDITELKRTEQEERRRADIEQHLIGIVSHDLRNPINAISMAAMLLLKQGGQDERGRRTLERILCSADRAARMLEDLLDFTQVRFQGSLPVKLRPLDLHELTRQAVEEVQLAHPHRQLLLEQRGEGRGEWDGDRLSQLITNLVRNALAYGSEHCAVQVRTFGLPDEVRLSVHNEGEPIPPELMDQLFQPLKRGDGPGCHGKHSLGLGLFIVKHIVEAHGGSISVDSTRESGTTFTVSLPRHPLPAARRSTPAAQRTPPAAPPPHH
ncbi:sensor histidine kinase [Hyalangium minutum]|uniref:histidine kinase n=1 Tax=Hyalangium minutum TaxID=394096 RepID=A0A085WJT3_9BACT|nr:sensor histidine kinase [Hyalangium minutum]KFE67946.1 hypothetical protein DB31_7183 [Hyalangium minutum]